MMRASDKQPTGYSAMGECVRRLRALGFDNAAIAWLLRDCAGVLERMPRNRVLRAAGAFRHRELPT